MIVIFTVGATATAGNSEEETAKKTVKVLKELTQSSIKKDKDCDTYQSGCSEIFENFCRQLYTPEHRGNIDLGAGSNRLEIRLGKTQNGFNQGYYAFQRAKIESQNRLPPALLSKLNKRDYFAKIERHLARKPDSQTSLRYQQKMTRLTSDLSAIWNDSIQEMVEDKMEKLHPGYHRLRPERIPPAWNLDYAKESSELIASIYRVIWGENSKWKQVESVFKEVKKEYIEMIEKDPAFKNYSNEIKDDWINRLNSVKLKVPGSDPQNLDHDCATTQNNSFNLTHLNYITVCAGDFNSGDVRYAIAHELGHTVGINQSIYLFKKGSDLGKKFLELRNHLCHSSSDKKCPEGWDQLKSKLKSDLSKLHSLKIENSEFLSCLQSRDLKSDPSDGYIKDTAERRARQVIGNIADKKGFLLLSNPTVKLEDGSYQPNPAYLNPCGLMGHQSDHFDWSEPEVVNFIFSAEYACSHSSDPSTKKLDVGIKTALDMYSQITEHTLRVGGKFSDDIDLAANDFALSPEEQAADSLGNLVFARLLKKNPSVEARRKIFLANNAWVCTKPSLDQEMPKEAQVEKRYSLEAHSDGKQRRTELMTGPIREVLDCKLDFNAKECSP